MALIIETYIVCDRCGESRYGEDDKRRPGYYQRELAQLKGGWVKTNSDICPSCRHKKGRGNKGVKI